MARILVVDDSLVMRGKLKSILTQAGHTIVAEAHNGMQACKEYEKHRPELVTMDITMPIMDGTDAIKKIIGTFPEAKIIIISALLQKNAILVALESGAKHYILKPFEPDKVLEVVNKVLMGDSLEKQSQDNSNKADSGRYFAGRVDPNAPTFSIENKNGTFIINVFEGINDGNLLSLNSAVQGLLFVKPLIAVFNFGDVEIRGNDVLSGVLGIMGHIKKADGELKIVSSSERLKQYVSDRDCDMTACCYSNISEVV